MSILLWYLNVPFAFASLPRSGVYWVLHSVRKVGQMIRLSEHVNQKVISLCLSTKRPCQLKSSLKNQDALSSQYAYMKFYGESGSV